MYDPHFEATVAEIRGFDLGDDEELLADLEARLAGGPTGEEWLLRGVLLHRAGRGDEAVECLDHAAEQGYARSQALYLKSCMLRDAGEMGDALEALQEAREAAEKDGLVAIADLDHAQGLLFWQVGNLQDALAQIDSAIEQDDGSAARWLHRGQVLAAAGQVDDARRALERALVEEPDLDPAMYERAALEASRGEAAAAAQWLTKAVRLEPSCSRQATTDSRFDEVRQDAALHELLASAAAVDLRWLDDLSTWMPALRRDPQLEALGLQWLGRGQSDRIFQALAADLERGPLGTMHTDATLRRGRELLSTRCAVAQGPSSRTRERVEEPCLLFIDVQRPHEGLWLALSESYPPFLWIRIEPRPDAVRRVLGEFFPRPHRSRAELPAVARGFVGYRSRFVVPSPYTGGLEPATLPELDRHFAINPFVESTSWGSAYDDDPWPAEIPEQPGFMHKISTRQRLVAAQARGHVWSLTRRTRHSRSYLTIEVHHPDIFVAQLRYQPSPHAGVVRAMNDHFGCDYPTDLPVDAIGALLGFQFDGAADLEAELVGTEEAERVAGLLYVVAALRHGDAGVLPLLRHHAEHAEAIVRSTVAEIAVSENYEALLEEMSHREPDPQLRDEIEAILDEGIPMHELDPYADDDDLEDDEDDDDDDGDEQADGGAMMELDEADLEDASDDDETVELDEADLELQDDDSGGDGQP